jgi:hypothetical protein
MMRCRRWSLRVYRCLLTLYPEDLRRDFGLEMLEAFENDLSFEHSAYGLRGTIRIWRTALCEVIWIALPAWLQIPAVAVPVVSAAVVLVLQSPLLIMAIRRATQASFRLESNPLQIMLAIGIDVAITALTSLVAVHHWKRAGLVSLGLGSPSCSKPAI